MIIHEATVVTLNRSLNTLRQLASGNTADSGRMALLLFVHGQ
jgi:hypothetical protein